MSGIDRIAAERQRQLEQEGWAPEIDGRYEKGELVRAARNYAQAALIVEQSPIAIASVRRVLERAGVDPDQDADLARMIENPARHYFGWDGVPNGWPWPVESWKPSPEPARNLEKAGALIAAEIDRLERLAAPDA